MDKGSDVVPILVLDQQGQLLTTLPRNSARRFMLAGAAVPIGTIAIKWVSNPPLSWRGVMARDRGRCVWCGHAARTIDHLILRSQGGRKVWSNGVACCEDCNGRRGDMPLKKWVLYAERGQDHPVVLAALYARMPAPFELVEAAQA